MTTKGAIITGGSRGIGLAVAEGLIKDGYSVALVARSESGLVKAKKDLTARHPEAKITTYALDVSDAPAVTRAFDEALKIHHSFDVVFNNAGIYEIGSTEISADEFQSMINVNLIGAFNVAKEALAHFKPRKSGYLINLASICGVHGFAGVGAYTATKFGLMGLSESLFRECAPLGIKVTAISPSWVNTDITKDAHFPGDDMIQPHDIYLTIRYLLGLSAHACPREIILECTSAPR